MFATDLTINTRTYNLIAQRATSSVRSDATQPLSEPNTLTISHENVKSGRRNSVVILEDQKTISNGTAIINDSMKIMVKVSYNPFSGRTDIGVDLENLRAELVAFLSVPANFTKLLNQES